MSFHSAGSVEGGALTKMTAGGCRAASSEPPARGVHGGLRPTLNTRPSPLCRRKPRDQPPAKMSVWVDQKKRRRKPRHLPSLPSMGWTAYCGPTLLMTEPNQAPGSHDRPPDCDRIADETYGRRGFWEPKTGLNPARALGPKTAVNWTDVPTMRNTSESEPPRRNAVWLGTPSPV